jgi:GntR family transcriptional regulator
MRTDLLTTLRLESSGVPIYVQLREQILRQLGAGVLAAGDQMPTIREVAVALKIDLNTVRHAYDELERLGAITLVRGRCSFVAKPPPVMGARATGSGRQLGKAASRHGGLNGHRSRRRS